MINRISVILYLRNVNHIFFHAGSNQHFRFPRLRTLSIALFATQITIPHQKSNCAITLYLVLVFFLSDEIIKFWVIVSLRGNFK